MKRFGFAGFVFVSVGVLSQAAAADQYSWTNWTSASTPNTVGGSVTLADSSTVGVSYTGDVAFAQTGESGFNYFQPVTSFVGGSVGNAPANGDIIGLSQPNSTNVITFSAPVWNPAICILSLGAGGDPVSYTFDKPFTLVAQGPSSAWGGSNTDLSVSGNTVTGTEGDGTIVFSGKVSEITFTVGPHSEYWNGITVGVQSVPEPFSFLALGTGVFSLARARRRR